jgi:hypothetical protein
MQTTYLPGLDDQLASLRQFRPKGTGDIPSKRAATWFESSLIIMGSLVPYDVGEPSELKLSTDFPVFSRTGDEIFGRRSFFRR